MLSLKKKYEEEIKEELVKKFNYKNPMAIPKLSKIVINRGLGESATNSKIINYTYEQLAVLTGQKPVITKAKKSISNFKLREGVPNGCKVTLRRQKMYDFLTKLINISLPKIRDFRGMNNRSFDGRGNYTLGIKEDGIFPELTADKIDRPRGFDISIITTATTDEEAYELLKLLGIPFRKTNQEN